MSRETFLARIRKAAAAGRAHRVHDLGSFHESDGYVGGGDDLPVTLAAEIQRAGGLAHLVDNIDSARTTLRKLLVERAPRSALCWSHAVLDDLRLDDLLSELGIASVDHTRLAALPEPRRRAMMLSAEIGITSTTYAIAETGSLAVASGPGAERLASLLPPVHVAVVTRDQILPDLFDLFALLPSGGTDTIATNVTIITGPSKTGDLELRLTTGVHGPGEWHVVIIKQVWRPTEAARSD